MQEYTSSVDISPSGLNNRNIRTFADEIKYCLDHFEDIDHFESNRSMVRIVRFINTIHTSFASAQSRFMWGKEFRENPSLPDGEILFIKNGESVFRISGIKTG